MKRLILSTVCMLFCATGLWAAFRDGIYYDLDASTQTASVSRQSSGSCSGDITIPSTVTYNGTSYSVKSIGNSAFYKCTGLTSVTIPNSVTSIGDDAFSGCTGLTSVTIGEGVTSIGEYAFDGCTGLTSVTIPNSVTSIGNSAFGDCTGLTSITIPNSVTSIGKWAFDGCTGLTNITIGNGVKSIGDRAFHGCSGLTSVTIPNSVTSIGSSAFGGCTGLTSIEIPNSVTSIGYDAFYGCSGLTSITIPNSVTSIGYMAFYGCTGLTSVTIPNSVTSIGDDAFGDCTGLTSIIVPCEKYDYFVGKFTGYATIIYGDCTFEVAVNANNENYGTVTGNGVYNYAKNITLTATPNEHYHFVRWSDGSTENPRAVKVTQDSIFTAVFAIDEHNVTASPNSATGTVIGEGVYGYGTNITLTAMPNDHYHFVNWSDGDTENPRTAKVTQDSTFTAVFAIDEHDVIVSKNIYAAGTVTGDGNYEYGTNITLTAAPNDHYYFVKWDDGNTENPRTVQVTQDSTFTAMFAIDEHNITVSQNSATGTVTGEGVYEYGTSITLTAVPNDHYHFVKWNDGNTDNPRTVKVTQDSTFAAMFAIDEHNVTISKNIPVAGTVTGDGVYEYGTNITLTATANEGYRFKGWSDGVMDASREITVTKDTSITANFVALYTIKALASASQGTVSGGGVYEDGEIATLVANAKAGYTFAQWVDGNDENPRTVTVNGNKTYTAIFAINEYNVTADKNISAAGTVTGDGVYEHNTTVQLTATANEGYRFKGWSDGVTDASREIIVTKDTSITANFVALYTIKALASASQGTVIGGGVYEDGETVTLVANPNPGYIFTQWVDGSDENPRTVTVDENKTYTAIFIEEESETTAVSETEESIVETARYDINGRPLTAPTKGVNIVKYSDGSFEKEFVR